MTRARLPNRRPSETETLEVGGQTFEACVGFDPGTWQPREVFLTGGKEGSDFDAMLADAATVISVALQHGVPIGALVKSIGRAPALSTEPGAFLRLAGSDRPVRSARRSTFCTASSRPSRAWRAAAPTLTAINDQRRNRSPESMTQPTNQRTKTRWQTKDTTSRI